MQSPIFFLKYPSLAYFTLCGLYTNLLSIEACTGSCVCACLYENVRAIFKSLNRNGCLLWQFICCLWFVCYLTSCCLFNLVVIHRYSRYADSCLFVLIRRHSSLLVIRYSLFIVILDFIFFVFWVMFIFYYVTRLDSFPEQYFFLLTAWQSIIN